MFSFESQHWCAFWQKIDMFLRQSIINNTSESKLTQQRKTYPRMYIVWLFLFLNPFFFFFFFVILWIALLNRLWRSWKPIYFFVKKHNIIVSKQGKIFFFRFQYILHSPWNCKIFKQSFVLQRFFFIGGMY